jgi:very-short-patch-repair endonuclease
VTRGLRGRGWKVLRIWEHELVPRKAGRLLRRLKRHLSGVDTVKQPSQTGATDES